MKYNNEDVLTVATCFIFLLDTQNARGIIISGCTQNVDYKAKGKDHYEKQNKTTTDINVKARQCISG